MTGLTHHEQHLFANEPGQRALSFCSVLRKKAFFRSGCKVLRTRTSRKYVCCGWLCGGALVCKYAHTEVSNSFAASQVERIVLETIEKVANEGFEKERIDAVLHQIELAQKEVKPYDATLAVIVCFVNIGWCQGILALH